MSDGTHCPFCGSGLELRAATSPEHRVWSCGSFQRSERPLQSDACRINVLERQLAESAAEVATCVQFLKTQYHWESFWADGFCCDNPSAADKNAKALSDFLKDKGHGKRLLERLKKLESDVERYRRLADGRICESCLEKHPVDSDCPPHEVRTAGQAWFHERFAEQQKVLERWKSAAAEKDAEIAMLRESQKKLHHRCQLAESAIADLRKGKRGHPLGGPFLAFEVQRLRRIIEQVRAEALEYPYTYPDPWNEWDEERRKEWLAKYHASTAKLCQGDAM